MEIFASYPIVPGITFLLILIFFGYQVRIAIKEQRRTKTPKLPNIQTPNSQSAAQKVAVPIITKSAPKNIAEVRKKYGPIAQFLSVFVLLLIVSSTIGLFYVYRNQSVPFIPRASGPKTTSPLLFLSATPVPSELPSVTPVQPTIVESTPLPTVTPLVASPIPVATNGPTVVPLQNSPTPTPIFLAKNSLTVTPSINSISPTIKVLDTITPKPTQSTIPAAGFPLYLGIFVLGSLIFLVVGFIW